MGEIHGDDNRDFLTDSGPLLRRTTELIADGADNADTADVADIFINLGLSTPATDSKD